MEVKIVLCGMWLILMLMNISITIQKNNNRYLEKEIYKLKKELKNQIENNENQTKGKEYNFKKVKPLTNDKWQKQT